jgi:CO/xanthine dehydrogenase FAD-binding subunit
MASFDYAAPERLDDALGLLDEHGSEAKVLAGGQSLVPILNYRLLTPRIVVDINGTAEPWIRADGDRLTLGALTPYHRVEESAEVAHACPLLAEAARLVGNVRVRALGTVGGSLAHADPAAEFPLVMVVLGAHVVARSVSGTRRIAARDLFAGYLTTTLEPREIVTEIEVPATRDRGTAIEEIARRSGDFAMVAAAALVGVDRRGQVEEVQLGYGGVGPRPLLAPAAADVLAGHEPTPERVARAARAARAATGVQGDAFASAAYRSLLVEVLGRRALARAVARALRAP